ncbi:hypothetical protein [Nocardiopsis lambiniae]|uniref:DUF2156 domain-containing protein n=1 Tax=Nocardiopsis lambiniae TaxID=3075539 RepID=A0ABU2MBB7_9ACTN|nr:hypothetical protein [Nocardiopsis sp. DSM 44743]MDT0329875.1 hypothetical protein [Nocardiopsis sp. DSM 44743]
MTFSTLERVAAAGTDVNFARVERSLMGEPVYLGVGLDGSLTMTVRGDHLPTRYRLALGAFRFSQYLRLGWMDPARAAAGGRYIDRPAHDPRRDLHTLVVDRSDGTLVGYVGLSQPERFGLEADYAVRVDVDLAPGTERRRLWEAKRLVRRVGMGHGQLARNAPWWALLALTRAVTGLREGGELAAMIGDGAPDGSPAMLSLLDYDVRTIVAEARAENLSGLYGPMWRRGVSAVPFHAVPHPRQGPLLHRLENFLAMGRTGSVRDLLRTKGHADA